MVWEVKYANAFTHWWETLGEAEQESLLVCIELLQDYGVNLQYPYSSKIKMSKYSHMRELRIQHKGEPYRILYAFDPRRNAVLLIGGNKTGEDNWYKKFVPLADKYYADYLVREERMTHECIH